MYTIEFFSRKPLLRERQWYWRARHQNGHIVAWSGEGYFNRKDCQASFSRFAASLRECKYDVTGI